MSFYWIIWASLAQLHYSSSLGFIGLPSTSYFLCFLCFGLVAAHSHFFTSYTTHGLLFLSFWASLSPFSSSRPICLSHGPVIHYSCCLGLMSFLSICQLFSVRVVGLLLSTWASKMAIRTPLATDLLSLQTCYTYNRKRMKETKHLSIKYLYPAVTKTRGFVLYFLMRKYTSVPYIWDISVRYK